MLAVFGEQVSHPVWSGVVDVLVKVVMEWGERLVSGKSDRFQLRAIQSCGREEVQSLYMVVTSRFATIMPGRNNLD